MAQSDFTPQLGNEQTVVLVMIETVEAFENLEAILGVSGVDGVLAGPYDLAISDTGDVSSVGSPRIVAMLERIAASCRKRGCAAAISGIDITDVPHWKEAGYTMIGLSSDVDFISEGMAGVLAAVREQP